MAAVRPPINFGPHARVSFGGTLVLPGLPDEIWNCNVSVTGIAAGGPGDPVTDPDAYLAGIAPKMKAWWSACPVAPQYALLDFIKCNNIGPTGKYVEPVTHGITFTGVPGSAAAHNPSIIAVCVTWRTPINRGRGARGRVYLPFFSAQADAIGAMLISAASVAQCVAAGKDLLAILAGATQAAAPWTYPAQLVAQPVVASSVDASIHVIDRVEVGNIFDVQRRRKDAYPEVYTGASFGP